jgi:hypothetical protein
VVIIGIAGGFDGSLLCGGWGVDSLYCNLMVVGLEVLVLYLL